MRRIILSLFAISAIVGVGVFATGAYFSDSINNNNYTFTTGTADLKFGFCSGVGADCSGTAANLDTWTFSTSQLVGPGIQNSGCAVIENKGDYALSLSSALTVTQATPDQMQDWVQVAADRADSSCNAISTITPWATARAAATAGQQSLGITLNPGDRLYVIQYNRWDSSGDQNIAQNGTLKLNTVLEGRTV
jgi:hypothetical protein